MVYVSEGNVLESRSPWRLTIVTDVFWGILNFVVLFFQTLISPNGGQHGNNYSSDYRPGGGPPPPPGRRMGGFRGGPGAPGPPPMAGGG